MTKDTVTKLEKDVSDIKSDIKEIKGAVIGEMKNGDKIGIKGHIAVLQGSITRMWWVIAVVVSLIAWSLRSG